MPLVYYPSLPCEQIARKSSLQLVHNYSLLRICQCKSFVDSGSVNKFFSLPVSCLLSLKGDIIKYHEVDSNRSKDFPRVNIMTGQKNSIM